MKPVTPTQSIQGDLGHRLRSLWRAQALTLADLSHLSGMAVPALSLIENGKRDVKLSSLVSLSKALRVSVADLFKSPEGVAVDTIPTAHAYDLGGD